MRPKAQTDLILEPAYADDFDTVYGDDYNETMAEDGGPTEIRDYIRLNSLLDNATKTAGEKVELKCEVAAKPIPVSWTWLKNNAPLFKSSFGRGKKPRVKTSQNTLRSSLRLRNLRVLDSGKYSCVASNAVGSVNATAVLKVRPGQSLRRPSDPASPRRGQGGSRGGSADRLTPPRGQPSSGMMPGPTRMKHPFGDGPLQLGSCVLYQGSECGDFLRGQQVQVTSDVRETGMDVERDIRAMMIFINKMPLSLLSQECKRLSHMVSCFHRYRLCDPSPASPTEDPALQICRRDCETISTQTCRGGFAQAKDGEMIGPDKHLPDCADLPGPLDADRCVPLLSDAPVQPLHWCYKGNGRFYKGTASETSSGETCLPWASAAREPFSGEPELREARNFCRNPGGRKPRPWCYGPGGQEMNCDIPVCPDDLFPELDTGEVPPPLDSFPTRPPGQTPGGPSQPSVGDLWSSLGSSWQYGLMAGGVGALVLLLLCLFCLCCKCCRRSKSSGGSSGKGSSKVMNGSAATHPSYLLNNSGTSGSGASGNRALFPGSNGLRQPSLAGNGMELNSLLGSGHHPAQSSHAGSSHVKVTIPQLASTSLDKMEGLGEGKFGAVWRAELRGYGAGGEERAVGVMQLAEDSHPRRQAEWTAELECWAALRHPNVLELVGTLGPGTLVFDFAVHGDLHKFLLMRSPFSEPGGDESLDREQLRADHADFLRIAAQIASGMEYLASCGIVHGDLATRNCFIEGMQVIKLTSFGIRRPEFEADYVRMGPQGQAVPLRWMPPQESPYPVFSQPSDVWAFGVTLWELHSYGTQPYFGYSDGEVGGLVRSRHLLEPPDHCPSRIYSLMVECWHEVDSRRPSFQEISRRLATWSQMGSPAASSTGPTASQAFPERAFPHGANRSGSCHSGTSASIPTSTQGNGGPLHHFGPHGHMPGKSPAASHRAHNNNQRLHAHRYAQDSSTSGGEL